MNAGAVWIIDNDDDDRELVQEVWQELNLPNELKFFDSAQGVLEALDRVHTAPFVIICELHLPRINGFELRQKMLSTNSKKFKSVPFIFWSTHPSEEEITHAYNLSAHGFFIKESSFEELKETFVHILHYWLRSRMPEKHQVSSKK